MKAVALGQKLAFLNHFNLVPFFILTSVKSKNRLSLALLAYMLITVLPRDVFEQTQVGDSFKCRAENVLPAIIDKAGLREYKSSALETLRQTRDQVGLIPGLIYVLSP